MKNSRKYLPVLWNEGLAPQPLNFTHLAPRALAPLEWQALESFRREFAAKLTRDAAGVLPASLLERAIADAWSLAALTPFPQLFLPALAEEKITEASAWFARQRILRESHTISFAA